MLIAAEYPIYGRFGYGPATDHADVRRSTPARRDSAAAARARASCVDLAELRKRGAGAVRALPPRRSPGSSTGYERWWDRTLPDRTPAPGDKPYKGYIARRTATTSGEPEGYVRYRTDGKWDVRRPNVDPRRSTSCCRRHRRAPTRGCGGSAARSTGSPGSGPATAAPTRRCRGSSPTAVTSCSSGGPTSCGCASLDVAAALAARTLPHAGPGRARGRPTPTGSPPAASPLDGGPDGATCAPSTEAAGLTARVDVARRHLPRRRGTAHRSPTPAASTSTTPPPSPSPTPCSARRSTPWCTTWF